MVPEGFGSRTSTGELVSEGDVVLLVMPQDIQAPKGRLILPQVQTMRELLDKKCIVLSATTDKLVEALEQLKNPPKLIITDSQVFDYVYEHKPEKSLLTSLRQQLNNLIHLDYEYLELEWSYKNKHFKSLCVVSNEHGGFIYDPIGSNILEYTTTTTTNTVERLNSKENLH